MGISTRRSIYHALLTLVSGWVIWGAEVQGQTSIQNFGSGTGSQTSQTGSAAFIPNPTTSGTSWARAGAVTPNAPIVLATASNPLGTTGAYVRAVASSSGSVSKFSPMVGYTGSTEFYTSFKVLFGDASAGSTATSGIWTFYQGNGAMYGDANDFSGAQVFTGLRFTYGAGGVITLNNRAGGSWNTTGLTTSTYSSATIYTIEIVGNNKTSGTISYIYNGVSQTVAVQKFDLYINGTLVGDDLAEAALPANTNITSNTFIGISSTLNVANVFVDDVVVYNTVPAAIGSLNQIDWANLQWPSTGTITLGGNYGVYAQVYEPGVTDAVGQGTGISCWIGYSTSNSDPSGTGWTWVPANYNQDIGNNDEYWINIGPSIPASGTYYLASRFQVATAPFVYGGYNVGGGGFWDGTNNISVNLIVNPPPQIDWANLQFPANGLITLGGNFNVYAQVYKSGVTESAGQDANITAWIGYSSTNSNPSGLGWTWITASYNVQAVNNDEYIADLGTAIPAIGTYYYASRFKYGLADYVYGGYNTTGGGFWDGTTNNSGVLTVNQPISQVVISQVYGGGGNAGATYKNDFIELFNRGTTNVNLNGWSVQYTSAAGPTWTNSTALTNVTLAPGQYYLIQEATGTGGTTDLPNPDATGSISISSSAGKVALVNSTAFLTGNCPTNSAILDFVGFGSTADCYEGTGAAPGTDNTIAVLRASDGCIDTDHNDDDFITGPPNPRNSSNSNVCLGILISRTALNGFTYIVGSGPSAEQSFIVEGKNLTNNIVLTAPVDYEISLVSGSGFTNTITLVQNSGAVVNTKIYVRLKSGLPVGSYLGEIISITSIGVTAKTVTLSGSVCPSSTLPFYENFDYTDGSLLTNNCWAAHSSAGFNPITVTSGSIITYPCYLSSGIGNQVILNSPAIGTSAEDVNRTFTSQTAGTVYASFLVNITSATTTGDYFFHLGPSIISPTYNGKVYVKLDASNNVYFGISKATGPQVWTPALYSLGTTYLIILKYTINPGIDNDVASIFINPPLAAVEPASGWLVSTDSPLDPSDIGSVALRQGSPSFAPELKLDGIRVSTSWSDISSPTPPPIGTTSQLFCASANKKVSDITVVGSGIVWYDASTAGTVVPAGTTLVNGTTYYASQTVGGCESISRLAVTVTLTDPAAPTVGTITQPTCALATATVALSGLPTSAWTVTANPGGATITGSTAIANFAGLTASTTYTFTVTLTSSGCTSVASGNAAINAQPVTPTAPIVGTITQPTCTVATGSVVLSGLPAGNWTINPGAIAGSTASATISSLTESTSYNFTVTNAVGCTSTASANVVINAQPVTPTAPTVGTITQPTCTVATGSVVLSGLPAGNWTINPGAIAGSTASATISSLTESTTYNFTVTNAVGCTSLASANVVINAQPDTPAAPTITASGPTTFCAGGSVTLTSSAGTSYLWSTTETTASITVSTAGSYTVKVTNPSGCQSASSVASVVTVNPVPTTSAIYHQ